MRLIDADTLIAEYDRVHIGKPGGARKLMVDAPTIEERKVGKWLKAYSDHEAFGVRPFYRYCSECNESTVHPYNFCPHCGARMEGNT